MKAWVITAPGEALKWVDADEPVPASGQFKIRVKACGVCRTDLHLIDGELENPAYPIIPGHQAVGEVSDMEGDCDGFEVGERVGVPWLGWTCGRCRFCLEERENLCPNALFTGYTLDGGYAESLVAEAPYCLRIPDSYNDVEAAPLLCAGLIGFRTYRKCGDQARRLGIYGFGSAAHLISQIAIAEGREVYAFTRPGDEVGQEFALSLGASWAGGSDDLPPAPLDAAMIFAPVGTLVVTALKAVRPGGRVVCGGIHMSDIPSFPYALLWEEREILSVANLTRADGKDFFQAAVRADLSPRVQSYALDQADRALEDLRQGKIEGSAVLEV